MGEIRELCKKGDSKIIWNPENQDETEAAREHFNSLIKRGYSAYSVKKDGEKNEKIRSFDANLSMIIMVPPLVGG